MKIWISKCLFAVDRLKNVFVLWQFALLPVTHFTATFFVKIKQLFWEICGRSSMVECQLPKLKVASSSLVARF